MFRSSSKRDPNQGQDSPSGVSEDHLLQVSDNMADYDEKQILDMYCTVLDNLLTPPHVKEQLVQSQSLEKKFQMIRMQKHLLTDASIHQSSKWNDQHRNLLTLIRSNKVPDIQNITRLKSVLSTANREFLVHFIDEHGIEVILRGMSDRIIKVPPSDLDQALLYELLGCCKVVMNNDIGMNAFLSTPYSVQHVAQSLIFDCKPIALLALEILSVCCFFSNGSTLLVWNGMNLLSRSRCEAPFSVLIRALSEEDIEIKSSILQFINNMIMGLDSLNDRIKLRSELGAQLFYDNYCNTLGVVNRDSVDYQQYVRNGSIRDFQKKFEGIHGSKINLNFLTEKMISSSIQTGDTRNTSISVSNGNYVVNVSPTNGTMAGICVAAKNSEKSKIHDLFGGKKTKHRWYFASAVCARDSLISY
jgi:hypothetical protein